MGADTTVGVLEADLIRASKIYEISKEWVSENYRNSIRWKKYEPNRRMEAGRARKYAIYFMIKYTHLSYGRMASVLGINRVTVYQHSIFLTGRLPSYLVWDLGAIKSMLIKNNVI